MLTTDRLLNPRSLYNIFYNLRSNQSLTIVVNACVLALNDDIRKSHNVNHIPNKIWEMYTAPNGMWGSNLISLWGSTSLRIRDLT